MKKTVVTFAVLALVALCTQGVAFAEGRNLVTLSLGGFTPGGDYEDGWDAGSDITFSYLRMLGKYLAFEVGGHWYTTKLSDYGRGDFSAFGIEFMLLLQPNDARFQPYIGVGPAIYINDGDYSTWSYSIHDTGSAPGGVLKAGFRAFTSERFHIGAFLKYFTNRQEVVSSYSTRTIDYGGTSVNLALGFSF